MEFCSQSLRRIGFHVSHSILVILHQETSSPGRVGYVLRQMGYRLDIRRPSLGDALPQNLDEYAGLIVFGGPMSANDNDDWLLNELKLIERAVVQQTPYLGLCLGAQMLCRVLGARVYKHPAEQVEIGYYPIWPTEHGETFSNSISAHWPSHVYHWHREGFDLPKGATALAEGPTFPLQAYEFQKSAFGLQFHPEVTYAMMCRWTVRAYERMQHPGSREPREHLSGWFEHDHAVAKWLQPFLKYWLAQDQRLSHSAL
jgi:GMP synthase (glutamine-hydrolysing)